MIHRQRWLGPAMFMPAILYIVALVGVPFVLAFVYSVGDVKVGSEGYHFVGLHNFISVLKNPAFLRAVRNSFIFTISSQILVLIGANILALALKDAFPGRRFLRFLILLPWVAPVSIGSIGWKWILDSLYSVINWVLVRMHLVESVRYAGVARRAEAGHDVGDRCAHLAHAPLRHGDPPGRV